MSQKDLAQKQHWDLVYDQHPSGTAPTGWEPRDYNACALGRGLVGVIRQHRVANLLEVGCGDSTWLPYLARTTGVGVTGIDYSERGCELARARLESEGVRGEVHCVDVTTADPRDVGQFDLVFSLGLVEHFSDTVGIVKTLLGYVRPGGTLLAEIPNLKSVHGLLSRVWQPVLLAKHKRMNGQELSACLARAGLEDVSVWYQGVFSLTIVAWELYPRWPRLAKVAAPLIYQAARVVSRGLMLLGCYRGSRWFAPFIFATGRKPLGARSWQPDWPVRG